MGGSDDDPAAGPQREAERAAERSVEAQRLLPGEDPATTRRDDAAHWVTVYSELLSFKGELLEEMRRRSRAMSNEAARREVEGTDLLVLEAEGRRLAGRLGFWRRRHDELGAAGPD